MSYRNILSVVVFLLSGMESARAEFIPGHIFVSDFANKHCSGPFEIEPGDRIWEIDPATGEVSLFVELRDEWCGGIEALIFTPDGTKLRAAQRLRNRILEFDSEANPTILYDGSDGIAIPIGGNAMAYDKEGNFFVSGFDRIVRFPAGSDISEIYADRVTDPLIATGAGAIAVDASGDVYIGRDTLGSGRIVRFQGPHNGSLFETFPQGVVVRSLISDSCGHLFAALDPFSTTDPRQLLRYIAGDSNSEELLAEFLSVLVFAALDPSESVVYAIEYGGRVYQVSIDDGVVTPIIVGINGGRGLVEGIGIAVVPVPDPPYGFTPCPPSIPTMNAWGMAILAIVLLIGGKLRGRCVRD